MILELPLAGAASPEERSEAITEWLYAAAREGINTADYPLDGSLIERLAWAQRLGLDIGLILSRYSSKLGHSTSAQITECMHGAAARKIYVPPEYICVDEGVTGRKSRRDGLERAKLILQAKLVGVILVYKVSRLFRVAYKGFGFVQEEVVDEGLRAISVSQGIDTRDEKTWKMLMYLHGMSDEMLLGTIADHVRSGQSQLFQQGYVIGALPVGYRPLEVPGARPTNLGRARTAPTIDPEQAPLIAAAFRDVCAGMPLRRAWKKYLAAGGASDPRANGRRMSYHAFRRLLANRRYTGVWTFGRKRNVWSNKRDGVRQVEQPDSEVVTVCSEELRIVDDATFEAVQAILAHQERGPRSPRGTTGQLLLEDLVTEFFVCRACRERFYQAGSDGRWMCCKNGDLCPKPGIVSREKSVNAICRELAELIARDAALLEDVVRRSLVADGDGDSQLKAQLSQVKRQIAQRNAKIADLADLAGVGGEEDRATLKAKIRTAQTELAELVSERARLEGLLASRRRLTPDAARRILADLGALLTAAADGTLGEPAIYRVLGALRALTGGRIEVEFEPRPGRKQTVVRGTFEMNLLAGVSDVGAAATDAHMAPITVEVWLRPPPRQDRLAERVHQLVDVEKRSYRDAAKILQAEGHRVNSGNVWQILRRYYEMRGLPPPERPYNNGHRRGEE